jgi:DNA-binding XRE family transcriptional regulator
MSMARTLDKVIAGLPAAQRRAVNKRASELIAEELTLRELRKALGLTQVEVARGLGKGQHEISRIEQRGDMLLSTLSSFVGALGGELEFVCRFKGRPPVRLRASPVRKLAVRDTPATGRVRRSPG